MSTVVEEPQMDSLPKRVEHGPDVSLLTDKIPERWRSPRVLAGMTLALGMIFVFLCSRPIWHTDVWGHVTYGRYIWETGSLPKTEPLLPMAKGMPFIDTAWLSQLIGYVVVSNDRLQLAGLQGLFALSITLCGALLAWRAYTQTRNGWLSLLALASFLMLGAVSLSVLRPQLAGLVCFVVLLSRLTARKPSKLDWLIIPVVFALWANLHASFLVGLGLLCCFCLGRAIDVFRRTGSFAAAIADARVKRLFLLTELAAVAVLLNPYQAGLYTEAFRFSANENLSDLTEWHPLTLRDEQGQLFTAAAIALAVVYRLSPRRVSGWEVLSLIGLGLATMWSARMMIWWAPVAALLIAQHVGAIWRVFSQQPLVPKPQPTAGKYTFVTIGLIWICFMISPLGIATIHGRHNDAGRTMSSFTPRFAAEYLVEHPPQGLVFNTYEWGDYLQWAGPRNLQLFVNSHAHLVPREVWKTYMQIIEQRGNWEEMLDRYGVNTMVLDLESREPLIKKLKEDDRWQSPPTERDGQVIFVRKNPIGVIRDGNDQVKAADSAAAQSEVKSESH